jgi:AcrR family transcriptional regulator
MVISSATKSLRKREQFGRNPENTQRRILNAARQEFAANGLGGARVDLIAARARSNKRMLYHYFGNKEELFRVTVEDAYANFRQAEEKLDLAQFEPVEALRRLVTFIWTYFLDHPEFITLVNNENLHRARHLKSSRRMKDINRRFVDRTRQLLQRGEEAGHFRANIDPVQFNISVAAISYYYLTNRFTGSIVFERDLMSKKAIAARLQFNIDTVLRMCCTQATLKRLKLR